MHRQSRYRRPTPPVEVIVILLHSLTVPHPRQLLLQISTDGKDSSLHLTTEFQTPTLRKGKSPARGTDTQVSEDSAG